MDADHRCRCHVTGPLLQFFFCFALSLYCFFFLCFGFFSRAESLQHKEEEQRGGEGRRGCRCTNEDGYAGAWSATV